MAVATLAERLDSLKYKTTDSEWLLFIQNHKKYIKEKSGQLIVTANNIDTYKYRPTSFLISKSVPFEIIQIVLIVNNIVDNLKFISPMTLYIPDESLLSNLKRQFKTFTTRKTKLGL